MTGNAIAATLFGPEDLRMVERPLGPLAPGMVRVRFGAGGICGSDLHYFRHARTGDFVVTSPLSSATRWPARSSRSTAQRPASPSATASRSTRRAGAGIARAAARAAPNLCENIYFMGSASKTPHMQGGFASLFDATPAQCVKVPHACGLSGGGARRAARGLPARGGARRRRSLAGTSSCSAPGRSDF